MNDNFYLAYYFIHICHFVNNVNLVVRQPSNSGKEKSCKILKKRSLLIINKNIIEFIFYLWDPKNGNINKLIFLIIGSILNNYTT